jgi:hypothetical protein
LVLLAAASLALAPDAYAQGQRREPQQVNIVPITVNSVVVEGGQLMANITAGSRTLSTPLTITPGAIPDGATCPILNLSLGPINLTLLGLNVDTSAICLDVTAHQGGGLLGDLLCGIANLLDGGTPLADVLAGLSPQDLARLNAGLTSLLNQAVFIPLTSSDALQGATCQVLSLALGPLDLNLLGLQVELDDCMGGPVTLDITATEGGGLLGDLLCNLSNLLANNASPAALLNTLRQIANVLGQLLV